MVRDVGKQPGTLDIALWLTASASVLIAETSMISTPVTPTNPIMGTRLQALRSGPNSNMDCAAQCCPDASCGARFHEAVSLDYSTGLRQQLAWYLQTKRPCCYEVDVEIEACRQLYWQLVNSRSPQQSIYVTSSTAKWHVIVARV